MMKRGRIWVNVKKNKTKKTLCECNYGYKGLPNTRKRSKTKHYSQDIFSKSTQKRSGNNDTALGYWEEPSKTKDSTHQLRLNGAGVRGGYDTQTIGKQRRESTRNFC